MKAKIVSLPSLRLDLKRALAQEASPDRRKEIGRALAAICRAERKDIDKEVVKVLG